MDEMTGWSAMLESCDVRVSYAHLREMNAKLLAALKAIEKDYSHGADSGDWGSWNSEDCAEIMQARAVIAEAEALNEGE